VEGERKKKITGKGKGGEAFVLKKGEKILVRGFYSGKRNAWVKKEKKGRRG